MPSALTSTSVAGVGGGGGASKRKKVKNMHERVRLVTGRWKEPGLDSATRSHAFNTASALREPDVPQTAAEQPTLAGSGRLDTECAKEAIDQLGIYALAIIGAAQLM